MSMARDLLMPSQRLMLSMLLMLMPHMLMDTHTLMDTDQSSVVLLLTQLVPLSPRDPHRVLARDQLMLSLSLLMPHMPHLSSHRLYLWIWTFRIRNLPGTPRSCRQPPVCLQTALSRIIPIIYLLNLKSKTKSN